MNFLKYLTLCAACIHINLFAQTFTDTCPQGSYRVILEPIEVTSYNPLIQVISPITKITKKNGDSFKKGELLLQMDTPRFLAIAKRAEANLQKARIELETRERLYRDKTGSYFDYVDAKSALANAEAELIVANKNVDATMIFAPYNGKVASVAIQKNEVPVEGIKMLEIFNDSTLKGKILIPSTLLEVIHVGSIAKIEIVDTGEIFEAKVARMDAMIDPASSTLKVEVEIDNAMGKLIVGMSGKAYFLDDKGEPICL